ncbi:MAG TPA: glycosyltransferase family 1 protein [Candidatus Binataceae bacterium]|nr:glycosyltransferase family 1 protein [Candidatus Binataceae bacterium]
MNLGKIGNCDEGIVVNLRSMSADPSGVQRYIGELCARFGEELQRVAPAKPLQGIRGHVWEQCWLPAQIRSRLLWSPANTGPLLLRHQVVTVHDVAPLDHPEWFSPKFSGWYRWMVPGLVRRARRVIAVSEFTKSRLVETAGADPAKIAVIPNGVDRRFRPSVSEEIVAVIKQLGIPSPRYVLSLGTLEPRKNLRGQLEAWSRCVGRLPSDTWLVVAGRAGRNHIFSATNPGPAPDRVHFAGFVPDESLPALYGGAIALLYPSIYEGFGLPALEAMASGTVPIVSNSTALPEVVGAGAVTLDPHDSRAIADAIEMLVTKPDVRMRLREQALRRAGEFNWETTAARTWDLLQRVSNEHAIARGSRCEVKASASGGRSE